MEIMSTENFIESVSSNLDVALDDKDDELTLPGHNDGRLRVPENY